MIAARSTVTATMTTTPTTGETASSARAGSMITDPPVRNYTF